MKKKTSQSYHPEIITITILVYILHVFFPMHVHKIHLINFYKNGIKLYSTLCSTQLHLILSEYFSTSLNILPFSPWGPYWHFEHNKWFFGV